MNERSDAVPFQLPLAEAARYLGVSASWLRHSDVPRVRLGRRVVWLREDLEAYAKARRTHGAAA